MKKNGLRFKKKSYCHESLFKFFKLHKQLLNNYFKILKYSVRNTSPFVTKWLKGV